MDEVFYELHDRDGVKVGSMPMDGRGALVFTVIRNGVAQRMRYQLRMKDGVPMFNRRPNSQNEVSSRVPLPVGAALGFVST